jgi:lantibiotic transport system permease protein
MLFQSEIIKIRHNFVLWLILLAGLTVPLLVTFDFIDHAKDISGFHSNPWNNLWGETIRGFVVFIGPFVIVMLTCMFMNIEHKYNAWKYMLTLPQKKSSLYLNKLVMNLLLLLLLYLLFLLFFFLSGIFLAWRYPAMGFLVYRPEYSSIFYLAFRSLLSFLGILAIHFWLSIRIKNMFVNIGIGLLCIFVSVMLFKKMDKLVGYPYEDGLLTVFQTNPQQGFLAKSEIRSLLYFLLIVIAGYWDFVKRFKG